ncbi:MAG: hypothetical protein AB202_00140 [Parcubacteria bacterium C7867-007]|nr:MAG: hypothetical protein AB202_00140 [Parcubacteria bacterium C7867-007]
MIGLSVSNCIADMVEGKKNPAIVVKIVSRTACRIPEDWDKVIQQYKGWPWHEFPEQAEALCREFIAAGKIEQPRLESIPRLPMYKPGKFWVRYERSIRLVRMDDPKYDWF